MRELGGPPPLEELARAHRSRVAPTAVGEPWWFVTVPEGAGQIGIWRSEFGFELLEEREVGFGDRQPRVNHWVLVLANPSRPSSSSQRGTSSGGIG